MKLLLAHEHFVTSQTLFDALIEALKTTKDESERYLGLGLGYEPCKKIVNGIRCYGSEFRVKG